MRSFQHLQLGLVAFSLLGGMSMQAQSPGSQEDVLDLLELLNTPVTTATMTAQKSGRAPATVLTVTSDQIQRRKYRSLGEVFRDLPEFKVDNGFSVEYYNTVSVRGVMGQYKFVILLDGARIGAATNEIIPILENFPVHYAKQIEVVYGPASALYGADAFTGIVNIVTWKGDEAIQNANYRLSAGQDSQIDTALFWSGKLGSSVNLSVGAQYFDDKRPNMPEYYPEEYRGLQQALDTGLFNTVFGPKKAIIPYEKKYEQPQSAHNTFIRLAKDTWSLTFFQNFAKVPSAINYAPPNALPNAQAYVAARTQTLSAAQSTNLIPGLDLQSTLTARRYEVDPSSKFINLFHPNIEPGYKYATSLSFRLDEVLNWVINKDLNFTSGLSWETSSATPWGANLASPVDTTKSLSNQGIFVVGAPIFADVYTVRSVTYGLFAQVQYFPMEEVALTLGARFDDDSRYGNTFNPRAGIVWTPTQKTTVKALYGSAFLAPSPYAAFRHYGGFYTTDNGQTYKSAYWRLANPGLKPEKENTLELSFRQFLTNTFSVTVALHQSTYKDLHTPMPDAGNTNLYGGKFKGWPVDYIEVTGNQGQQVNKGGNLQLDYLQNFGSQGRLNFSAAYSFVDGKVEDAKGVKTDMGYATPKLVKVGVDLAWGAWSAALQFLNVGTQNSNILKAGTTSRETIPGYSELNLTASYTYKKWLEAFVKVTNLTDARYKNINENAFNGGYEFNGMPQDPRRIAIGLRGHF